MAQQTTDATLSTSLAMEELVDLEGDTSISVIKVETMLHGSGSRDNSSSSNSIREEDKEEEQEHEQDDEEEVKLQQPTLPTSSSSSHSQSSSTSSASSSPMPLENASTSHNPRPSPHEALCCPSWTRLTNALHSGIIRTLVRLSQGSARRPWQVLISITVLSFAILGLGLATNFNSSMDINLVYAPLSSPPLAFSQWITDGLPNSNHGVGFSNTEVIAITVLIHANGDNVLTRSTTRQAMQVMANLQSLDLYHQVCDTTAASKKDQSSSSARYKRSDKCSTYSVTNFWDDSLATFDAKVKTDADIMKQVAAAKIGNTPVSLEGMLGNYRRVSDNNSTSENNSTKTTNDENDWITWAQAFHMHINFPARVEHAKDLELEIAHTLLNIRTQWMDATPSQPVVSRIRAENGTVVAVTTPPSPLPQLTFLTPQSMELEVLRTTQQDIPLIPFAVVLMVNFTALVFFQRHKVKSRCMLGYAAVMTTALAIITAFGSLFIVGIPVTTAIMVVPFIVLGIGLDNIFVISDAYFRISRCEKVRQQQQQQRQGNHIASSEQAFMSIRSIQDVDELDSSEIEYEGNRPAPQKIQACKTKQDEASDDDGDRVVRRIRETMEDVGMSITLTTSTTMIAFLLTSISDIRGIRWLGFYSFMCVLVSFVYQVTLFVALLVLDERRINANRRDICCWSVVPAESTRPTEESVPCHELEVAARIQEGGSFSFMDTASAYGNHMRLDDGALNGSYCGKANRPRILTASTVGNDSLCNCSLALEDDLAGSVAGSEEVKVEKPQGKQGHIRNDASEEDDNWIERFMRWYSERVLLNSWFQGSIVVLFLLYFASCCYSTTLLQQQFKPQDYLPAESYIKDFIYSADNYLSYDRMSATYFRFANQSDPAVQQQMKTFIEEMVATDAVGGVQPPFCWVRDFSKFEEQFGLQDVMKNKTFVEQLDFALSIPAVDTLFGGDIVRDPETGEIVASRCWFYLSNLDVNDVNDQLEFYNDQMEITASQRINAEQSQSAFFTFDYQYFIWAYYRVIVPNLVFSLIVGVAAVTIIGITFMPHWTAGFYICPLILVCYVDVMGTIQFFGLHINSFTFVCIVISIGLLVDYLFHILLRYYESTGYTREIKIQQTLQTMGASVSVGALSTFLGILPLAFSTSAALKSVFLSFVAMLFVGIVHGLVVLPVLLSLLGPVNATRNDDKKGDESKKIVPAVVLDKISEESEV